ncbi:uncharacterized protein LY89DRAFT_126514 [Mollisia scopiformis]|uniref:Uncharacterized protein n=1 Tax=Mollisia scopiformis TaxID=149040 RepID=A0A194X457_MOLSC|nr:uncharacterized protein LY89DRAFT_126514 [Mollisia scopiformis]KUJ14965.1 hypothetical protein LY89DRAFT_126514 [Mollisia scopiformis]
MVTVEHEIPSGMEYQYADHTISERPGPILKAGMGSTSQAEHPPAPSQGPNSGQYAERRRQFYIELDTIKQKKLSQASQRGGPNHALNDYQLQLEILELENKKRHLQRRIDQDAGQAIASPLVSKFQQ